MFWVDRVYIRCCGNGGLGFRPDGDSLFLTNASKKVSKKKARPDVRPLAGARCSFVPAFIWGHRLRSASRRPPLDVCGFAARRYAPAPQMNASTQPAEGAGESRSKAGELPLGLLSGEERSVYADLLWELACQPTSLSQMHPIPLWELACQRRRPASRPISCRSTPNLWELACQRWRPVSQPISPRCTQSNCGSEPARDDCPPVAEPLYLGTHFTAIDQHFQRFTQTLCLFANQ